MRQFAVAAGTSAVFRIAGCAQMRHAQDTSHESRAWNLCSLEHTGSCEQHLSTCQSTKKSETPWSRRTRLREMIHGLCSNHSRQKQLRHRGADAKSSRFLSPIL